jgi:hypothetical protein
MNRGDVVRSDYYLFISKGWLDLRGPNSLHLRSIRGRDQTELVDEQRLFQAIEAR